ncbi:Pol polyprotein [Plakobranchus ocellatus]|uniref:Pol polyprotein n=1 Tax=Plakobranchus ocellatus TaxID=259542 RepID=A0AAV3ZIN8_9GAST|nr:Pol polyprotein [Plakobranchus ocellatus]
MAFAQLPSYPPFDTRSDGIAVRWTKWVSRLKNNLFVAYDIATEARKKALLLTYAGPDLNDVVEALLDSELQAIGDESPFDKLVSALNQHFNPKVNKEIQRYQFRRMSQTTELNDDFYTALRHLASSCEFTNPDEEIKSQIIAGCRSSKVREKGLNNPNITLTNLLQFARTCELTQKHAQQVEKEFTTVNKLGLAKQRPKHHQNHEKPLTHKNCRNCGTKWPHEGGQKNCPAYNKTCSSCGKANHFASVCKSKTTQPHSPDSKLDLNQGYHQLELNEESRYITGFATHRGLYRYKRLNFGMNSAAEIFQEVIRQTLNGLSGVINVSDDILVYGKSKEVHSQNLRKVLERLRSKNLTLNKKKCEFMKPSIEFLGYIFSAAGFKPCPGKLQEICEMPTPTCTSEVRSLLGMMNFCGAHFIPDYATLTYELRRLTQKNTAFKWTEKHDEALGILKSKLKNHITLCYFNPNKDTQVYVDANPVGISAILTQTDEEKPQIVQIASRDWTDPKRKKDCTTIQSSR